MRYNMYDARHFCRKLLGTMRIACTLVLARTLGEYVHSVTDHDISYAVYRWRGKEWAFPTEPMCREWAFK